MTGQSVDFSIEGVDPETVYAELDPIWDGGLADASSFTHIDLRKHKARWSYSF